MHRFAIIAVVLALACVQSSAQTRSWRNTDGSRSVRGDFVKRDAATLHIVRSDRKEVAIPLELLHPDDRKWLDATHPFIPPEARERAAARRFITMVRFGDTREEVLAKLEKSPELELTIPKDLLGRTGLNGAFRTTTTIGGLKAFLFFDWTPDGRLSELQLRTESVPAAAFQAPLTGAWKQLAALLTDWHGNPVISADALPARVPADGQMVSTHAWQLGNGGTAQLGPASEDGKVFIAAHFSSQSRLREIPQAGAATKK